MANPIFIIKDALSIGELDKMLLGEPGYCYVPKFSPASGRTDLAALIVALYDDMSVCDRAKIREEMLRALNKFVQTYEGLEPVAGCILIESLRRAQELPALDLPLDELAAKLQKYIGVFAERLKADKEGVGATWPDGRLGEIRRLSRNTRDCGGPTFWL